MKVTWLAGAVLGLAATAAAGTCTVDDSGGADFTSIDAAIAAAADGDVILVKPGLYSGFSLHSKSLVIAGIPDPADTSRPSFMGPVTVSSMENVSLVHITISYGLAIDSVAGTVIVDDVIAIGWDCVPGCAITHCPQVLVNRSNFSGMSAIGSCETPGLYVADSAVNLSWCNLFGGSGGSDGCSGRDGEPALLIGASSRALLAEAFAVGGDGGNGSPHCGDGGDGAPAIRFAVPGSSCIVRGNQSTSLIAGVPGSGMDPGIAPYVVDGPGNLVIGNVKTSPSSFGPGVATEFPQPPEPFLRLSGFDAPGNTKSLFLYAPAGSLNLVLVTIGYPDATFPSKVGGPLFLSMPGPLIMLPMTGIGMSLASVVTFQLPRDLSALHGVVATFQGVSQGSWTGTAWLAGNPLPLVIR